MGAPARRPETGGSRLAATIPAEPAALVRLRDEARDFLSDLGVDDTAIYAVDLVLEELVGNVLRHGCADGASHAVELSMDAGPALIAVCLRDDALEFDPTRQPAPRRPDSLQDAPIGGRGLPMVRRVVRALRYRREDGWNCLEVEVARAGSPGAR